MQIALHVLFFLFSAAIIWLCAGFLVDSVNRVAQRFNKSGFAVAFFVLGFLTSISEISVSVNSSLSGMPQISVGNLIGASLVILLLIIPLLAIVGNGIALKNTLTRPLLLFAIVLICAPSALVLDGSVSVVDGLLVLGAYVVFLSLVRKEGSFAATAHAIEERVLQKKYDTVLDVIKIAFGAACIFFAGHLLVDEAAFFSITLGAPASLIGLIVLSIGTNVPELVIAIRAILKKHKDIAFGDYLGSAVMNTALFGFLGIFNESFAVERSEFLTTFILTVVGLALFYFFSQSKNRISRNEGLVLLSIYVCFFATQVYILVRFAENTV